MNIPIANNISTNVVRFKHDNQEKKVPVKSSTSMEKIETQTIGASLFHHHLQKVQQSLHQLQMRSERHTYDQHLPEKVQESHVISQQPTKITLDSLRASNIKKFPSDPNKSFHLTTLALFTIKHAQEHIREHLLDFVRFRALQTYRANL